MSIEENDFLIEYQLCHVLYMFAIVGILIGAHFSQYVPEKKLRSAFGWFVLTVGIFIFIKELIIG